MQAKKFVKNFKTLILILFYFHKKALYIEDVSLLRFCVITNNFRNLN